MEISIKEILTRDIIIVYEDGTCDTNKYGEMWQLIWDVKFTEGNKFIGHAIIASPQAYLTEFTDLKQLELICSVMRKEVNTVKDNASYSPITQPPARFTVKLAH